MIVDTLDNINFYFGMSRELDAALTVLKHYNLSLLDPGDYYDFPIAGCNTTLKILEPEIVTDENAIPWEYHENQIDVQCVLTGVPSASVPAGIPWNTVFGQSSTP